MKTLLQTIALTAIASLSTPPAAAIAQGREVPVSQIAKDAVAQYFSECDGAVFDKDVEVVPTEYFLNFRYGSDDADAPARLARLVEYLCFRGAYNFGYSYLLAIGNEPLLPISFAVPTVDVVYGKDEFDEPDWETVERIDIVGFSTITEVINPRFELETMSLSSFGKGRGLGDSFTAGTWSFHEGQFVLTRFAMDATTDGEADPQLDVSFGPPLMGTTE